MKSAKQSARKKTAGGSRCRWLYGWPLLLPLLTQAAPGLLVHFAGPARFATATPVVSQWLRPDLAVVGSDLLLPEAGLDEQMAQWRQLAGVRLVEVDAPGRFATLDEVAAPDDPLLAQQRWLEIIGARRLWSVGDGRGVTVAVIDSGVDRSHPDLQANLLPGYDFGDFDDDPQDTLGHGTAVTGLLAAAGNNGIGISGLAPAAKILPFKVSASSGPSPNEPRSSAVVAAILRATEARADIINLSLEITEETQAVQQALQAALAQGILVVAAAGNGSGQPVSFPARLPGVLAVANSNDDGTLYRGSNLGPEVALAAPGVLPVTTLMRGQYGARGSGTSYSAPIVAAVLAVLRGANPHWSPGTLLRALQSTAKAVPGQTFGSLQAGAAAVALSPDLLPQASATGANFAGNENLSLAYRLPPTDTPVDVYVAVDTPAGSFVLRPDGGWQTVESGYLPLLTGYRGGERSGSLFGPTGAFPALPLNGLPHGAYRWRVGLVESASQRALGPVVATPMRVGLP